MTNDIQLLRREFRRSEEARYIHRLHGVLLVLLGLSTVEAGRLLGVPQRTIAQWTTAFKERGLAGLQEAKRSGRPSILDSRQRRSLVAALKKTPIDAGLSGERWTGQRVKEFLWKQLRVKLTMRHCRRLLRTYEKVV